jgi:hypothetical protein
MEHRRDYRFVFAIAGMASSLPIFVIGSSFIFGHEWIPFFGVAAATYAVISFATLAVAWKNPVQALLRAEQVVIAVLACLALWVFLGRNIFEHGFLFASGALAVFAIKFIAVTYISRANQLSNSQLDTDATRRST